MLYTKNNNYELHLGKMQNVLAEMKPNSIDAVVTDPPYEIGFTNKGWDSTGVSYQKETWEHCLRVLKPGGYLLAFGGTRTYHRIACAVEDAGFEIRDCIMWLYGSGFPKSVNIGLAIDRRMGVESIDTGVLSLNARPNSTKENTLYESGTVGKNFTIKKATNKWSGWGTCLKPAYEPIIIARKPFQGSLVDNVINYGVGGLNIDGCRINDCRCEWVENAGGRFPANIIHDGSEEVVSGMPCTKGNDPQELGEYCYCWEDERDTKQMSNGYDDEGSASRYFYCAKASKRDRDEGLESFEKVVVCDRNVECYSANVPFNRSANAKRNTHPTVKPTALMQYLIRLVCPKDSIVLDPFNGSGSTGKACMYENKDRNAQYYYIGVEMTEEYLPISKARLDFAINDNEPLGTDDTSTTTSQSKISLW